MVNKSATGPYPTVASSYKKQSAWAAGKVAGRQPGATPGIDNRKFRISERIDEGVRSGRITQREARNLHSREREIERHEARFKSDGVVTAQERRQLGRELTALRDEVQRMMRNDRRGRG